jgi:hypothetical protein
MENILLDTFKLAGGQYYELKDVIEEMHVNDFLNLIADPENSHDEYAVEVYWDKHKLGFLSRTQNRIIHNLLINDIPLVGIITQINKEFSKQVEFDILLQL